MAGTAYIIKKTGTITGNRFNGFNINAANANYYKVVNTGGSDNFYSNFQYQKENGWDTGWSDDTDVVVGFADLDTTYSGAYGINTENPIEKLHVVGNVKSEGYNIVCNENQTVCNENKVVTN